MHSRSLSAYLSVVLGLGLRVAAQGIAQCLSGWEWNQNSLGQDPCTIGTMLDAACRSDPLYYYEKLNASEWYTPPSKTHPGDMTCDCDTVMYSLVMACATCQGGISYGWDSWSQACDAVYVSQYSGNIPPGTAVPHWAFYNVTLLDNQQFDNDVAKSVGRNPEQFPTISTTSAGPHSTGAIKSSSGSNTAAIVGGVVGGVGALIIIPSIVYLIFWLRRRSNQKNLQPQYEYPGGYDPYWKPPAHSPTHNPSFSTGPTVVSDAQFQPYIPHPQPASQPRPISYVTPISNYASRH